MTTIKATEFKAKCLHLMDRVSSTGESIVVTKRGKAVAVLSPPVSTDRRATLIRKLQGVAIPLDEDARPILSDSEVTRGLNRRGKFH